MSIDGLPFKQEDRGNKKIRIFSETVLDADLKWHWDEEDRVVTILHETDWLFQFDNRLPQKLDPRIKIEIPKGEWHRLIKGSGNLEIEVEFI